MNHRHIREIEQRSRRVSNCVLKCGFVRALQSALPLTPKAFGVERASESAHLLAGGDEEEKSRIQPSQSQPCDPAPLRPRFSQTLSLLPQRLPVCWARS